MTAKFEIISHYSIKEILKHDLFLQKSNQEAIYVYGYGHHRINVTEDLQNSHACVMMSIPEDIPIEITHVFVEIMNQGEQVCHCPNKNRLPAIYLFLAFIYLFIYLFSIIFDSKAFS